VRAVPRLCGFYPGICLTTVEPGIVIYPYNKNQQDAPFTFNLFQKLTSTCFEQAYCSSSGSTTLYIQQLVYVSSILVLPTASQHKRMTYTNCCIYTVIESSWNVMVHAQKPDFVFRRNGQVHLNRRGASVQSNTGSRGVRIGGSIAG